MNKKIKKLDPAFMGSNAGSAGASLDEVVLKINEIVDVLNGETPELRESEDERIRKELIEYLRGDLDDITTDDTDRWINWIEKQKDCFLVPKSHLDPVGKLGVDGMKMLEKQKEQKPNSTEDMPYITDEHFYEREHADSFKYKLAEYMTKCCTKKEGPYGYEYGISAESILQMAKEELIKRGELKEQKPAEKSEIPTNPEWSEKKINWDDVKHSIKITTNDSSNASGLEATNKSPDEINKAEREPAWKPTEEQMNALNTTYTYLFNQTNGVFPCLHTLETLFGDLKKLM